jgi:hypothetical protein
MPDFLPPEQPTGLAGRCTHEEYKDLSDNVRHYNTHFLALLSIFLVIVAGLVRIVFWKDDGVVQRDRMGACIVGVMVTLCFWFQAETYLYRQRRFEERLKEMEPELGYNQYSRLIELQSGGWFRGRRVGRWCWRVVFVCACSLWIYGIVRVWN